MIGISTYLVAMVIQMPWQPEWNVSNSFVLSPIEFIFGMELLWDERHQHIPRCYGNIVAMSTRVKLQ